HDPQAVELALHELALKELVRPARQSSMEGESEYGFWHLLVRDVAYAQIPRAERARRHRSAAIWIERKAGERVEDLAEVLAYHYLQALELAEAAGETTEAEELRAPARHFLALAGERALGLDTKQAEARLSRALELTVDEDPDRLDLLVRWADAVYQAGDFRKSADILEQALASLRARGETEASAQALQLQSRIALRRGEGRSVPLAAEAIELLEQGKAGPALVAAYEQLANAQAITGAYPKAIAAANRARELAETLGILPPARALGYHGYARAYLGDPDGLAEMEKAHALLVERGSGQDAAFQQNNLAIARYPLQGPAPSLAAFEEGIAFCVDRGLAGPAAMLEANCPALLIELGRPNEALELASRLAVELEASGNAQDLCEVRASEVLLRLARGEDVAPDEAEWLIDTARAIGSADTSVFALSTAARALVSEAQQSSRALLAELDSVSGSRETPYYGRALPTLIRTALLAEDRALAEHLVEGIKARYPLDEHALCAARAQLAEAAAEHALAADLYAEAAERWCKFGNVPERAYALLGQGRCVFGANKPEAEEPLRAAQALFKSMGYRPALDETEALLDRAAVAG
ncbi:MAG: hypothetical protein C5B48_12110, partial [Candidatus Rokuibacteriota bacterium]